jgi:hypothetical protein
MGNLISRTFVDLRHKQVVAVAEMSSRCIPGAHPLPVAPLHIYKTAHITYTVETISITNYDTTVISEPSATLTSSFTLPATRSPRFEYPLFFNASVKSETTNRGTRSGAGT